jgi:hypothetical protein
MGSVEEKNIGGQKTAYRKLTERELSGPGIKRFMTLKDTLKISDNDAIWGVVYILEMYTRIIEDFNSQMRYAVYETIKQVIMEYAKNGGTINVYGGGTGEKGISVERVMLWLGAMLFISIAMFYAGVCVGAGGTTPLWLNGRAGALNILLGMPAGWIFFVIVTIPSALYLFDNCHEFKAMPQGKERNIAVVKYCGALLLSFIGAAILLATILNK